MNNPLHIVVVVVLGFAIGGIAGYSTGVSHQKQADDSFYADKLSEQNLKSNQECDAALVYLYDQCVNMIEQNCSPNVKVPNSDGDPKTLPQPMPSEQGL